jgi:chromosomal replication initiation ATPase DnaA
MTAREQIRGLYYAETGLKPSATKATYRLWLEKRLCEQIEPVKQSTEDTVSLIITSVAKAWGVPVKYLFARSRCYKFSHPRMVAMEIMSRLMFINYNSICHIFGSKTHDMVVYSRKFVVNQLRYKDFKAKYEEAMRLIEHPQAKDIPQQAAPATN